MELSYDSIQQQLSLLANQAIDPLIQQKLQEMMSSIDQIQSKQICSIVEINTNELNYDEVTIINDSLQQDPHQEYKTVQNQLQSLYDEGKMAPAPLEILFDCMCDFGQKSLLSSQQNIQKVQSLNIAKSQLLNQDFTLQNFINSLADQFTFYGSQTGFKLIIPKTSITECFAAISDLFNNFTPKICAGMTLDEQECQRYLEDTGIYPKFINSHQLAVIFKKAVFRQSKLIQEISMQNSNQALVNVYKQKISETNKINKELNINSTNYVNIKRLSFFGFQLLLHSIAEHVYQIKYSKQQVKYEPEYKISTPYDTYKYSDEIEDIDTITTIQNSWKIADIYAKFLDKYLFKAHCYGLTQEKPLLSPDLKQFPQAIRVFSKYTQMIKNIFSSLKTESRLVDSYQLFKILSKAEIHSLLSREFVFEVVYRNFLKVDKETFIPGLNQEQFLVAIFVCSNFALCQEPYIRQYKRPEERLEYVLKKLLLSEKTRL
ncbi:hypothetical protein SS50377_26757 [Spironucleus salmonicida]|uniref:Uncharacterized protein n=1 Tax=Spironucleus salmonicida TaxID=348837 RepID=V6LZQ5_9EUKA|nr:hypothetical protein SS50377_26757 [Spironucleus salmonicida]|eukprot:EST49226.1 hypothetical protein SS50377_10446 [Spironucleus salmonicida]